MALSDPLVLTVNGVAKSMPRVSTQGLKSTYQNSDESFSELVSHEPSGNNRTRTLVSATQRKIVTDPLTAANDFDFARIQIIFDRPQYGFTEAEIQQLAAALFAQVDATFIAKLLGKQS